MKAFQIKITLKDVHPPVWRRLIVPGGYTFTDLTEIFIEAMGWSGYHLSCHYFSSLHLEFENDPEDDYIPFGDIEVRDADEYMIDEYLEQVKSYTFTYDFGDDWEHKVEIEKILEDYDKNYPQVIKYKGDTPKEDCGGPWGFEKLKRILQDPDNEEYEDMMEWSLGSAVSPYDLDATNEILADIIVPDEESLSEKISGKMTEGGMESGFEEFMREFMKEASRIMQENGIDPTDFKPETAVKELTLLLLFLTRMRGNRGDMQNRSWKTYPWDALDELERKGQIESGSKSAKSVYITEEGLNQARLLMIKYGIEDWMDED